MIQSNPLLEHFETVLKAYLDKEIIPASRIQEAIHYVLFPGGKRLRPLLVYATGRLVSLPLPILDPIAIAIELMHAYSLVHDDLPAMDNDDYRRGRLTCHKAFDEATAILTGDALHALALQALLNFTSPETSLRQIQILLQASGPNGMISGQSLDLTLLSSTNPVDEAMLSKIHQLKTAELLLACIKMVLEALPAAQREPYLSLESFALTLGLAYQMQDDYLDIYHTNSHGKKQASDEQNNKTTFAKLYTASELKTRINTLFAEAKKNLSPFTENTIDLYALIELMHQL